eukprot:5520388-Pleurochrysis_carterae.AAC.1
MFHAATSNKAYFRLVVQQEDHVRSFMRAARSRASTSATKAKTQPISLKLSLRFSTDLQMMNVDKQTIKGRRTVQLAKFSVRLLASQPQHLLSTDLTLAMKPSCMLLLTLSDVSHQPGSRLTQPLIGNITSTRGTKSPWVLTRESAAISVA